jgi:predicted DNA-binding transcriptional regulator AlpA
MKDDPMYALIEKILQVLLHLEDLAEQGFQPALENKEEWLDAMDMLQKLHISRSTLYRLKKEGHLVPTKLGKKEFYLFSDVKRTLKDRLKQ